MNLSSFEISTKQDQVVASCIIQRNQKFEKIWFSTSREYESFISTDVYDPFIVSILYDCMSSGETLSIEGPVSSTLMMNIGYYNSAIRSLFPNLRLIQLNPNKIIERKRHHHPSKIGLGFSCGVDSMCSLYTKAFLNNDKHSRITHLFNFNVGSHGKEKSGEPLWRKRLEKVNEVSAILELPVIAVNSNIDDISLVDFESSYAAKNVAPSLLLSNGFKRYYVASNNAYEDLCPESSNSLCDHLLSNDLCQIVHDGSQFTRLKKIKLISEWEVARRYLNVCTSASAEGRNCSCCTKCVRFMVTADILGLREEFSTVFDFSNIDQQKNEFIKSMNRLGTTSPNYYWKELVDYMEEKAIKMSPDCKEKNKKRKLTESNNQSFKEPFHRSPLPVPYRLSPQRAYFFMEKKGLEVLEVGCNSKDIKNYLTSLGLKHTGFDLISKSADVRGDMCDLPFGDETYDAILINSTLQYAKNPFKAINEFKRVLRSNGTITGTVPFLEPGNWDSLFHFTAKGLLELFSQCGFSVEYIWPNTTVFEALEDAQTKPILDNEIKIDLTKIQNELFKKIKDPAYNLAGSLNFHVIKKPL